ncbi:MAG: thiamine pyrophosphate-binding protein [Nitrososphaerota archaeon]|nr:thiamine pyrophosphate-binding protein [Nitrososphaerota archaeon]
MLQTREISDAGKKDAEYGSDFIVDILKRYDIEYLAANIGSTFRGLWESLINYGGDKSPQTISCCHEEIAVAIAHGYAKATGKPMVALLHDTVGLLHATMAVYNAWCDRVPIILLGASGPMDTTKRRPWIDWVHTSVIPNDAVREYIKWDDFPFTLSSIPQSFARAYNMSITDPMAPVFINFDSEYMEQKLSDLSPANFPRIADKESYPVPSFPPVDVETLELTAKMLLTESERPIIIAGTVGRNKESVRSLIDLAEASGTPVHDTLERFNFPNTHPLDSPEKETAIGDSDAILALDMLKLEAGLSSVDKATRSQRFLPRKGARIVRVGPDELLVRSWPADYQGMISVETSVFADTSKTIPKLTKICKELVSRDSSLKKEVEERHARAKSARERETQRYILEAKRQWNDVPISLPRFADEVWQLVKGKSWVIANGSLERWTRRLWDWEEPGCYLGPSGGGGLGYGLPASIGAALGLKNEKKLVIDFQSDGDLLFTAGAFWTAAHYEVPLLVIMFNNRLYFNDADHNKLVARARGRDSELAFHNGGDIDKPPVDFAQLARSQGVFGVGPVSKPEEIRPAVEKAMKVVELERKPALVDVITKAR